MTFLAELVLNVFRIVFLRGSPERIPYSRGLFITALFGALAASACAQALFFGDHLVFVILRVFAEITMFMMMIVLLTAKIPRFRLARMMLVLVMISLLTDISLVLLGVSLMQVEVIRDGAQYTAYAFGALALYGASNTLAWGLQAKFVHGLAYMGMYAAATVGLDLGFRELYQIVAAS